MPHCDAVADEVEVTGAVIHLWGRDVPGARCDCRLAVIALHVSIVSLQKAAVQVFPAPTEHSNTVRTSY